MLNLDFNRIRSINGTANDGFEEFVCQLARKEEIPCKKRSIRNGNLDVCNVEIGWWLQLPGGDIPAIHVPIGRYANCLKPVR